jgi:RNA polymerase sigma-70 factor (ECF subfamily)
MSNPVTRVAPIASRGLERPNSTGSAEQFADSDLVKRAIAGDRWAEEALYRRHGAMLLGLCTRLLRDRPDAEDVLQDAFVDALGQLSTLRDPAQFSAWLTAIAVHKVHRRLRRRKLLRLLGLWGDRPEDLLESCLAPGVSAEHYADIVCLDQALQQLADAARIAWQLRHVEGCRLEEVAQHCGCSLATAKRRIAEADALVRRYIEYEGAARE